MGGYLLVDSFGGFLDLLFFFILFFLIFFFIIFGLCVARTNRDSDKDRRQKWESYILRLAACIQIRSNRPDAARCVPTCPHSSSRPSPTLAAVMREMLSATRQTDGRSKRNGSSLRMHDNRDRRRERTRRLKFQDRGEKI